MLDVELIDEPQSHLVSEIKTIMMSQVVVDETEIGDRVVYCRCGDFGERAVGAISRPVEDWRQKFKMTTSPLSRDLKDLVSSPKSCLARERLIELTRSLNLVMLAKRVAIGAPCCCLMRSAEKVSSSIPAASLAARAFCMYSHIDSVGDTSFRVVDRLCE